MFQLLELIENEEDREFCRKLSEQFDSAMYHVAYGILKNSADAEDAVQESYIAIINKFNSHPRFPFCKRVSHFESDLQILYPTFHFCNDFPVFSLAFMI